MKATTLNCAAATNRPPLTVFLVRGASGRRHVPADTRYLIHPADARHLVRPEGMEITQPRVARPGGKLSLIRPPRSEASELLTPKGLKHSAQGCEARATLGSRRHKIPTLK